MKLRVLQGSGPTGASVRIVRTERLTDDDDEAFCQMVDADMTVTILEHHLTAEGARVLEELLSGILSAHWVRRPRPSLIVDNGMLERVARRRAAEPPWLRAAQHRA